MCLFKKEYNRTIFSIMIKRWLEILCILSWLALTCQSTAAQISLPDGSIIKSAIVDGILQKVADSVKMPGVSLAFISNGKVVYLTQYGYADVERKQKVDQNTIFEACSMSKPVFAYFVMKMADQKVIGLDTPLYRYLPYPELSYDDRYKLITARMVLAHTTGLPNWVSLDPPDTSLHISADAPYLKFKPGTGFSYSGTAYQYLVRVMCVLLKTDDRHLTTMVDRMVCRPLGMHHAKFGWNNYISVHKARGYEQENDNGINLPKPANRYESFNAAGGLETDARDYATFLIGLLDGKGLSGAAHSDMLSPQSLAEEMYWGLGIAIKDTPYGRQYLHSGDNGNFKSYCMIYKNSRTGFVLLTNGNRMSDLRDRLLKLYTNGQ